MISRGDVFGEVGKLPAIPTNQHGPASGTKVAYIITSRHRLSHVFTTSPQQYSTPFHLETASQIQIRTEDIPNDEHQRVASPPVSHYAPVSDQLTDAV